MVMPILLLLSVTEPARAASQAVTEPGGFLTLSVGLGFFACFVWKSRRAVEPCENVIDARDLFAGQNADELFEDGESHRVA